MTTYAVLCNRLLVYFVDDQVCYVMLISVTIPAGHGDSNGKNLPTLVKDVSGIGQVACGSSHTIIVSQDGRTVWSFGGGDNGNTCFLSFRYCEHSNLSIIQRVVFIVVLL